MLFLCYLHILIGRLFYLSFVDMPKIQSHLQYAKNLEETTKSLSSIQGAVLKYKQKIDETGNIINTISNSFFNIQNN